MKIQTSLAFGLALIMSVGQWLSPVFANERTPEQTPTPELSASVQTPASEPSEAVQTPAPEPSEAVQTSAPEPEQSGLLANTIVVDIEIADVPNLNAGGAVFGIYTKDFVFWGAQKIEITKTKTTHQLTFPVPEYYTGELFYLMPISGVRSVLYCTTMYPTGAYIPLSTYAYLPTSPEDSGIANHFTVTATPQYDRPVKLSVNLAPQTMQNRIKIRSNYAMAPLYEFLAKLGVQNIQYNADAQRIQIDHNGKQIVYFLDTTDVWLNGQMVQADTETQLINGEIYIPLRFTVENLGYSLTASQVNDTLKIAITMPYNEEYDSFVNTKGISSRTDYMIWISKSDYKVNVFQGYTNNWRCIRSFSCSIGAPSTPTVTGQFEYFSKESRWSYPTYYVGPIMRFYRGYAIHSTLLRYDGSTADGRLGMKISHGCVRVHPDSINWLVNNIPLYTKIYITN